MKLVSLVSSGIDSPVATYLLSKKTDELIIAHGDNRPFTDDNEIQNFKILVKRLKKIIHCPLKIYLIPHGTAINIFKQNCNNRFTCIFCKRMLLRYAEKIAEKEKAQAIIMGDSLGQVASQTIENIHVIEQAITLPVLRPLIGLDKEDIVKTAKNIGTYDLSILPSMGCKAVPHKPATKTRFEKILEEENKIDVKKIVETTLKKSSILHL